MKFFARLPPRGTERHHPLLRAPCSVDFRWPLSNITKCSKILWQQSKHEKQNKCKQIKNHNVFMSVSQYLLLHIITLIITGPNLESERYWRFHWRGGQLQLNVTRSTSAVCTSQGCSSIATKEKAVQRGRVPAEFHQFHHMIKVCRTLPLIYWSYLIIFDHQSDRTKCIGIGISSSKEQKAVKICQDYIRLHTFTYPKSGLQ